MSHVPVMVEEVLQFLNPQPNQHFIDCTLGDGGHTRAILERTAPHGKVLAFDLDPEAVVLAKKNLSAFGDRLIAVHANYADLTTHIKHTSFGPIAGVLMDFGFSSAQLNERGRGFSFMKDEPLDMRYNPQSELTAAEIVNSWPKEQLTRIIAEYGDERLALRIAQALVTARGKARIIGTQQLVAIIVNAVPRNYERGRIHRNYERGRIHRNYERGRIHPATRTFQALRIAVNDELGSIERVLPLALDALTMGGALVAISFHSLEDRIVKQFFKAQSAAHTLQVNTRRPVTATQTEINQNSRARSAKLRAAHKN